MPKQTSTNKMDAQIMERAKEIVICFIGTINDLAKL